MYEEKLSIIIPTKDRQQYAFRCIKTLLAFPPEGFEVVVHDNSGDSSLQEMLGDLIDGKRLKYAYSSECLSFCANFEKAMEMATGDYSIMIGDDDCVFPQIVELTKIIREKGIEAVSFCTDLTYLWPNAVTVEGGKFVVRKQFNTVKKLFTENALKKMKATGNYDYQKYPFPRIYHGIIKREKFDLVKEKTGHYFGGLTPDIFSAVALSYHIDKILYVNTPFTIPGVCKKSGAADSLTGRHTGELKDAPHFRGHSDYAWDSSIPYVYSVDTIWAETVATAVRENGEDFSLSPEEYFSFLKHIIRKCPMFRDRMLAFYSEKVGGDQDQIARRFRRSVKALERKFFFKKCCSFALQLLRGRYVYRNVADIEEAIKIAQGRSGNFENVLRKVRRFDW